MSKWMVIPFYVFAVGLIVFLIWFYLWSIISDLFSFSKAPFFLLLALALTGFLKYFFYMFFSFSEELLFLNSVCLSTICMASNMGMPSKSGRAIVAFEVMFL